VDLVLQLLATGLVVGSLRALCAIGWGLIYGTTLHFHVAHGAVFALAVLRLRGPEAAHLPLVVAVLLAIVASAASGLLIDLLLYQQLDGAAPSAPASSSPRSACSSCSRTCSPSCSPRIRCAWTSGAPHRGDHRPVFLPICTSSPSR
jgi:hypothetical protein